MVSRNNGAVIREAIQSVLAQSYQNWELVLVDNASEDDSWDTIRALAADERRIRPIRARSAMSLPKARNFSLCNASGKYMATIDGDDAWQPERLTVQMEFMRACGEKVGVCGSNCLLVDKRGKLLRPKQFPERHEECLRALWFRNPFCHSATLVPRAVFERCGSYNEEFLVAQDLELWFRIGKIFRLHNLQEFLVRYRTWSDSVTFRGHRMVVRSTLRARRLARLQHGYEFDGTARIAFCLTWLAQWAHPTFAQLLFRLCLACVERQSKRQKVFSSCPISTSAFSEDLISSERGEL